MSWLIVSVQTLPISTVECERGFSQMNIVCSDLRSSLTVPHMSSLMFIGIVGPPLNKWNPQPYVKSWLAAGRRDATSTDCPARKPDTRVSADIARKSVWKLFNAIIKTANFDTVYI